MLYASVHQSTHYYWATFFEEYDDVTVKLTFGIKKWLYFIISFSFCENCMLSNGQICVSWGHSDLDLWPPKSNYFILESKWMFPQAVSEIWHSGEWAAMNWPWPLTTKYRYKKHQNQNDLTKDWKLSHRFSEKKLKWQLRLRWWEEE